MEAGEVERKLMLLLPSLVILFLVLGLEELEKHDNHFVSAGNK